MPSEHDYLAVRLLVFPALHKLPDIRRFDGVWTGAATVHQQTLGGPCVQMMGMSDLYQSRVGASSLIWRLASIKTIPSLSLMRFKKKKWA